MINKKLLNFFLKKRKREVEDRRLAFELASKEESSSKIVSPSNDLNYALKILSIEDALVKNKAAEQAKKDELLARQLYEKDKAVEDASRKKKELEASDLALAKALKEKEELEAEVSRLKTVTTPIISSFGITSTVPKYWVKKQSSDLQKFDVYPGTEEYGKVMNPFFASVGLSMYGSFSHHKGIYYSEYSRGKSINVVKVTRNQNLKLWAYYSLKVNEISSKNGGDANEQWLYHGSRAGAYDAIMRDGFDIRVASMSGAYGAGIYFATQASTSRAYCSTLPNGNMAMLICKVIVGSVGTGHSGLRRPPPKYFSSEILHDSVSGGGMYVIFDNYQAYPMYLVEFNVY